MVEWRPIETLKMDGKKVLMALSGGDVVIAPAVESAEPTKAEKAALAKAGVWPDCRNFIATHWMPLPEPPQ